MNIINYFFDLDGTLLDTNSDIRDCMKDALRDNGFSVDSFESRYVIGPPLVKAVQDYLPGIAEEQRHAVIEKFKSLYDTSTYPRTTAYPGIESTLTHLYSTGKRLFIATNKRRYPTLRLLEKLGWTSLFTDVITSDSQEKGLSKSYMLNLLQDKWNTPPEQSIMVGDADTDILAGKAVKFHTAAVLWGYGDTEFLLRTKPDWILSTMGDLP